MLSQRKAELDEHDKQIRMRKMTTAMEVKKQKAEAAQRKAEQEVRYQAHIKENYMKKMHEQDSVYSASLQELQELERQEKTMVEVLN
jgi:membrane-anchored protein YejM (alkaline phosphatase superfamily)